MRISDWSSDVCSSDLGAFGVLLLILWLWLYSNPRESGKVSEAELAWIEHDPPEKIERIGWGKIVTKREAWAFAMAKFLTDPVWFMMLFWRSEEHTSELQSLMRISYAVFSLNKKQHDIHTVKLTDTKHNVNK